jgi:hypothetical protein
MYRAVEKVPEFNKLDMMLGGNLIRQNWWIVLVD